MGWKARWWQTLWSLLVVCKRGWSGGGQGGLQGEADRGRGELFKGSSSLRLIVLTCIRWPTSILTIARPLWADSRTGFWSQAGQPPSSPSACKRLTNSTKSDRNHSNLTCRGWWCLCSTLGRVPCLRGRLQPRQF